MKSIKLTDINGQFTAKDDFDVVDEKFYDRIRDIKESIKKNRREKPIILVSGPSGSGKTTSAYILEKMLDDDGLETHTISLDNYFKTVNECERGKIDYESPNRVDGELLTEHIKRMIKGEKVDIPVFDFVNTRRSEATIPLSIKKDELVIFEGIHSLNPSVISAPDEFTAKIYISVDTSVQYGEDMLFAPEYIRLLRRIARDKLHRGRDAATTIGYFDSVKIGEKKYVEPFLYRADYNVDSFIGYEPCVYADILKNELSQAVCVGKSNDILISLNKFLSCVDGVSKDLVSDKSLIREFI